ncbi:type II toxin-antitoxin system prevent-host-death family antitoxin [Kitasatospora sp. NPDC088264]|uniref:type II toxin-antitoxin system Phd/YefM family antitoxin n=1 Tax=Kitasatospora sp. NPDC088264 TaxID=3155296 RepID=UPI003420AB54
MKTTTYSESRAHYAEVLNAVTDDREEIVITRAGHEPVVTVSLEDHQPLKETAYLLRSRTVTRKGPGSTEPGPFRSAHSTNRSTRGKQTATR